jgi:kynurenine formamidase
VPLSSGWSNQWIEPSILLCLLHTEIEDIKIWPFFTVDMNSLLSDETSTTNHSTTQCHIPEHFYEDYPSVLQH